MEPRAWLVTILFGSIIGIGFARFREDRGVTLTTLVLTSAIGAAAWVLVPDSIAGPSLTVGGACAFLAAVFGPAGGRQTEP